MDIHNGTVLPDMRFGNCNVRIYLLLVFNIVNTDQGHNASVCNLVCNKNVTLQISELYTEGQNDTTTDLLNYLIFTDMQYL